MIIMSSMMFDSNTYSIPINDYRNLLIKNLVAVKREYDNNCTTLSKYKDVVREYIKRKGRILPASVWVLFTTGWTGLDEIIIDLEYDLIRSDKMLARLDEEIAANKIAANEHAEGTIQLSADLYRCLLANELFHIMIEHRQRCIEKFGGPKELLNALNDI